MESILGTQSRKWRSGGATTGGPNTLENYRHNARFRLVALADTQPDLSNAGFTKFHSCDPPVEDLVREKGWLAKSVPIREYMRYEYLVVADGFTSPWPRFFWGLHSNSVLIRQESNNLAWVDNAAVSGVHYIPVQADLSDLVGQLNWAKHNNAEARLVSQRARKLAAQDLTQGKMLGFIRLYLQSYARLFG